MVRRTNCKILYVVGQLRSGGQEQQLCYLLQTMDRTRYQPAVAVWNFRDDDVHAKEIRSLGVPLYGLPTEGSRLVKLAQLRGLVARLQPQIIHSYSFYTNFPVWYATLRTAGLPVGSVRSNFAGARREAGFLLGRLCARWPRSQIFNSFSSAVIARRFHAPFIPRHYSVVRNGVDLHRFVSTPLPRSGHVLIAGVGSLVTVKRWDRLLKAVFELKQQNLDFSVKIAGEGPLQNSLLDEAKILGVADRVVFCGQTTDIPSLLSEATLLVHTSASEGCPNVVMEAMASGRPVVATGVGDASLLVEDGKTGFIVKNGDDDALMRRIAILISNRALCRRMGEAARAKAEREFGLHQLVNNTFAAYRDAGWIDLFDAKNFVYESSANDYSLLE